LTEDGLSLKLMIQVASVEQPMARVRIIVPSEIEFSDLKLGRDTDGSVSFDWTAVEIICNASGIDVSLFQDGAEDNIALLITHWYGAHVARGGARDPVADDLFREAEIEDRLAGGISHPPGHA
jgi:hypothetical protein